MGDIEGGWGVEVRTVVDGRSNRRRRRITEPIRRDEETQRQPRVSEAGG